MNGRRRGAGWLATHAALLAVVLIFGLPFLWLLAAAVSRAVPELPWPTEPTLEHLRELFRERNAGRGLRNSLIVATAAMALTTVTASLAGYGLSRLNIRHKTAVSYGVLLLQTFPLAVTMVPIYDLAIRLGLQGTYRGLIVSHAAISLPLAVWLMKSATDAVPREVEEAAWLDGASLVRAWRDIVVPLTVSGLAVTAGFAFVTAWAEVLMAVVLLAIGDVAKETLPFQFYYQASEGSGVVAALAAVYIVPVIAVFLLLRRLIVRGLAGSLQSL
ncbi:MAG TPA: carbohydrate ABC transporter permease [Thermomicrobiales bacterium]